MGQKKKREELPQNIEIVPILRPEFAMILEESFPLRQRCISASHSEPDTIWNCLKHIGDQAKR
jgi:hypothetical protein